MPTPKFKPGQSGNLKGRPKGKPSKVAGLRAAIEARADDVLQSVIDAAVNNADMTACKMLLDRISPTLKPQSMVISLPVKSTLVEQGEEVIRGTMAGEIPPDVGAGLITALANQGKLVEVQELAERLSRIEKKLELQNAPK
jgi:hypothetical protein